MKRRTMTPLQDLRKLYQRMLHLAPDDRMLPDFLLSVLVGNQIPVFADPLWCWLIGPAGSGKNESMMPFTGHATTMFISELTENALMSGYVDDDDKTYDPSLLPHLDGKTMIVEDTANMFTMRPAALDKLMGALRNLYGGEEQTKHSGAAGARTHQARFGILFGSTPAADNLVIKHAELGERFIAFRIGRHTARQPDAVSDTKLEQVHMGMFGKTEWRSTLREQAQDSLNRVLAFIARQPSVAVEVNRPTRTQLYALADFLAKLRTVPVGGYRTDPETGNRLIQQFITLGTARALADERSEWQVEDTWFILRVANDTLPRWVVELLCLLAPVADEGQNPRPQVAYGKVLQNMTAVAPEVLKAYVNEYKYLGFLTPESTTGYQGHLQLTERALRRLQVSGLLFGERGQ